MTKAKAQYEKFWNDVKPYSEEYCHFWMNVFGELGFKVSDNKGVYNMSFAASFDRPDGTKGEYTIYTRPTSAQGITIWGGQRYGKYKPVKCLSETGVIRFCEDNHVGNLK